MSDNEKRTKPKYEAPIVVALGEMAKGVGYCAPGSNASVGYCTAGFVAASACTAGGTAPAACTAGTAGPG